MRTAISIWNWVGLFVTVALATLTWKSLQTPLDDLYLFTLAGLVLFGAVFFPVKRALQKIEKARVARRRQCGACGYSTAGLDRTVCPECGRSLTYDEMAAAPPTPLHWFEPRETSVDPVDVTYVCGPAERQRALEVSLSNLQSVRLLQRQHIRSRRQSGVVMMAFGAFLLFMSSIQDIGGSLSYFGLICVVMGAYFLVTARKAVAAQLQQNRDKLETLNRTTDPESNFVYELRFRASNHGVDISSQVDRISLAWVAVRDVFKDDDCAVLTFGGGAAIYAPSSAFDSAASFQRFVKQARAAIDDVRDQAGLPARPIRADEAQPDSPPTSPV